MRVIRSYWKDWPVGSPTLSQIPEVPPFNDVIYVYGEPAREDVPLLEERGYDVRVIEETHFNKNGYVYGRKLVTLFLGMQDWGEVLMIDWDCVPTREVDFEDPVLKAHLKKSPLQVPIYAHPNQRYSYPYKQDHFISPNFGFVYCGDIKAAHRLLEIAINENLDACVEEHAMYLFANEYNITTPEKYIEIFQPIICHGVDPDHFVGEQAETHNGKIQLETISLVESLVDMDIYFKHI